MKSGQQIGMEKEELKHTKKGGDRGAYSAVTCKKLSPAVRDGGVL